MAIVISGDTHGWIVPCGCTSNQSGGLSRRGTYVAGLRDEANAIVADVGGAPAGTSAYEKTKFEAILDGEMLMGIAAHNIGGPEAKLGGEYLRGLVRETRPARCAVGDVRLVQLHAEGRELLVLRRLDMRHLHVVIDAHIRAVGEHRPVLPAAFDPRLAGPQ